MSVLQLRLQQCLQTILDLEPRMETFPKCAQFQEGMNVLKNSLATLKELHVTEDDVVRFEQATVNFIDEMWLPLQRFSTPNVRCDDDLSAGALCIDSLCDGALPENKTKRVLQ